MFEVLLPLLVVSCSILLLTAEGLRRVYSSRKRAKGYHQLQAHDVARPPTAYNEEDTDEDDDEFAEHLSLRLTMSKPNDAEIKVDRPRGEYFLVALEQLAIIGMFGIYVVELATGVFSERKHRERAAWAGFASWVCAAT